jgi:leucyl aminopeptidase
MTIQTIYKKNLLKKSLKNLIFFVNEKFDISNLKNHILYSDFIFLSDLIKTRNSKKEILVFDITSKKKIILVSLKNKIKFSEVEKLGAKFYDYIKETKEENFYINSNIISDEFKILIGHFLHGIKLKSYSFEKYKTKKNNKKISIIVFGKNIISIKNKIRFESIEKGIFFARDLVSEPGNILHPDEYVNRLKFLKKYDLKVNIYNEKKLHQLGMHALLGVGKGSTRGSYLVTLEWNGLKAKTKPLAFVGKGVCFDTGGISLKPAKFMEDMTYDMAGSAVVVGLMKSLALRKAKVNAVGVVGLVENMPDGNAQRPGDIVKSYSGKTIEVLNTDAEGRLVLADAINLYRKKIQTKIYCRSCNVNRCNNSFSWI